MFLNVISMSMQRHDIASMLRRRCIDIMCLLGCYSAMSVYHNKTTVPEIELLLIGVVI